MIKDIFSKADNFIIHNLNTVLLILLIITAFIPLLNLGNPKLGSNYEARVVVTGRTMEQSGNWVVPYLNGEIRLQKPPLPYWTIAGIRGLLGQLTEFKFRLPSAVMGIIGVFLTLLIGKMIFSWRIGLLAGLFQSLTVKYIVEARAAKPDIYVTFWVLVSLFILTAIFYGKKRRDWLWIVFFAVSAMGLLSKWNMPVFILPPMIYGLWVYPDRRGRAVMHIAGIVLFFAIVLAWGGALIHQLGFDTVYSEWNKEFSTNIINKHSHHRYSLFYYFSHIFALCYPWFVLVPVSMSIILWSKFKQDRRRIAWLTVCVLGSMLILSLASKKKITYFLPAVPFMAVLTARLWASFSDNFFISGKKIIRIFGLINIALVPGIGILLIAYAFISKEPSFTMLFLSVGVSMILIGYASCRAVIRYDGWTSMVYMLLGLTLLSYALFGIYLPAQSQTSSMTFANKIKNVIGKSPIVYYRDSDETLMYYLNRTILTVNDLGELQKVIQHNPDTYVIVKQSQFESALKVTGNIILHKKRFRDNSIPIFKDSKHATEIYVLHS